jgi:SagB-type dehydrogenase family enzyme
MAAPVRVSRPVAAPPRRRAAAPAVGLAPHCLAYAGPDGAIRVLDPVHGAEYELSRERFVALLAADDPALDRKLPASLRATAARRRELAEAGLGAPADNRSLLSPLELACHRLLNRAHHAPPGSEPEAVSRKRHDPARAIQLPLTTELGPPVDLADCLARRSSRRVYADRAMPRDALAAALALGCRTRALIDHGADQSPVRPYPSGGGRYSLEVYPIVYRVADLAPGAYHYDPSDHALSPLDVDPHGGAQLLALVRDAMAGLMVGAPAVVLIVTSRFARTARRYRFHAYHLILEELGALYQTLYLAAERLGLAACALGQVRERWTGAWLGFDGVAESQVGLFALGVPAPVQATVPIDAVERPATPALRCAGELVRLVAGDVAYTIPLDELELDLPLGLPPGSGTGAICRWPRRGLVFALSPRAAAALHDRQPSTEKP